MADETLQQDNTLATPTSPRDTDGRVTDNQYTDNQYAGNQYGDSQVGNTRSDGSQLAERQPTQGQFTDSEVAELRRRLDDESGDHGGSRFGWFLIGFFAALLSITVAALVFLAVSDTDDDGNINLDVPSVNVEG